MNFTWRVSDCEELVGAVTGDDGYGFMELVIFPMKGGLTPNIFYLSSLLPNPRALQNFTQRLR